MKSPIPLLTWIEKRSGTHWDCEEYPFRILSAQNYTVRHYELYDNYGDGKKFDGRFYAPINAMDFAKKIYKMKIKKGEFVPKKKEKVEKKKVIYASIEQNWEIPSVAINSDRYFLPSAVIVTPPPAAAPRSLTNEEMTARAETANTNVIQSPVMIDSLDSILDRVERNARINEELAANPIVSHEETASITLPAGSTISTSAGIIRTESPVVLENPQPLEVSESSEDLNEFGDFESMDGEETPW